MSSSRENRALFLKFLEKVLDGQPVPDTMPECREKNALNALTRMLNNSIDARELDKATESFLAITFSSESMMESVSYQLKSKINEKNASGCLHYLYGVICERREGYASLADDCYLQAAEKDYAPAQTLTGSFYYRKNAKLPERIKAPIWEFYAPDEKKYFDALQRKGQRLISLAAEQGYPGAHYELGLFYRSKKMNENAMRWFHQAALQGHPKAMDELGLFYYDQGEKEKAVKWYHRSLEQQDEKSSAATIIISIIQEYKDSKQEIPPAVLYYAASAANIYKQSGSGVISAEDLSYIEEQFKANAMAQRHALFYAGGDKKPDVQQAIADSVQVLPMDIVHLITDYSNPVPVYRMVPDQKQIDELLKPLKECAPLAKWQTIGSFLQSTEQQDVRKLLEIIAPQLRGAIDVTVLPTIVERAIAEVNKGKKKSPLSLNDPESPIMAALSILHYKLCDLKDEYVTQCIVGEEQRIAMRRTPH